MASNINPNNIDGSYPVAGQDNNSQGFRDNFTNTKQNFQFAEDEINDLQAKVLLKAALIGQPIDNNMNDNLIYAAHIRDFAAPRAAVTPAGVPLTATINYATSHYQTFSTTASTKLAFQNFPTAGNYGYVKIQINITNVAHTITLPAAVSLGLDGVQGISPGTAGVENTITFGATGFYELAFGSYDGGSTITLFDLSRALTDFTASDLQVDDVTATGFVSATGNVVGGNTITSGFASAAGNVTGGNLVTGGQVVASGNVAGGNVTTAGSVSATGNISGTNINGYIRPSAGSMTAATAPIIFTSGSLVSGNTTAGSVEYDGTVVYLSPTVGQRGVLETSHIILTPSAGRVLAQNTSSQAVFTTPTNGTIALPASMTYDMEAVYYITNTAAPSTAHSISVLFATTGSFTSISYIADVSTSSGSPTAGATALYRSIGTAGTAVQVTPTGTTTSNEVIVIQIRGTLRTNGAGNVTPQIQYNSSAPGGISTVLTNSFFKLTPMGTSTVSSVGAWT
jgi:hypothetical protein